MVKKKKRRLAPAESEDVQRILHSHFSYSGEDAIPAVKIKDSPHCLTGVDSQTQYNSLSMHLELTQRYLKLLDSEDASYSASSSASASAPSDDKLKMINELISNHRSLYRTPNPTLGVGSKADQLSIDHLWKAMDIIDDTANRLRLDPSHVYSIEDIDFFYQSASIAYSEYETTQVKTSVRVDALSSACQFGEKVKNPDSLFLKDLVLLYTRLGVLKPDGVFAKINVTLEKLLRLQGISQPSKAQVQLFWKDLNQQWMREGRLADSGARN